MKNKKTENNRTIINIGTSLMVVILIGLSFAVIAALAISSSQNNYNLSKNLADHTTEYYEASNEAMARIAMDGWEDNSYEIKINDKQNLEVQVANHEIESWKVTNQGQWDGDDSLSVHTIEDEGF